MKNTNTFSKGSDKENIEEKDESEKNLLNSAVMLTLMEELNQENSKTIEHLSKVFMTYISRQGFKRKDIAKTIILELCGLVDGLQVIDLTDNPIKSKYLIPLSKLISNLSETFFKSDKNQINSFENKIAPENSRFLPILFVDEQSLGEARQLLNISTQFNLF